MEQTNLYSITVPALKRGLQTLSVILDKAQEHAETKASERRPVEIQMKALINARTIFDQFPLKMQIQMACDNAKGGVGRLAEIEVPSFEDNEETLEELKERIQKTIKVLDEVKPEQIIGKENIKATISYFPGKYFTGFDYATQFLLPNFYFHVTTAYTILRKNGVDVGKEQFMGQLPFKDL